VFDGVGGDLVGRVAKVLPSGSTIYAYGFLGGNRPLDFPTMLLLIKSLTLTYFGIIFHPTVRDPEKLKKALEELQGLIWMPHFKTKVGKKFMLEEINAAMQFSSASGGKAVLCPFI
jgi:NADPH:quinone reductase-like Zn-dependent oxidoreductase